MTDKTNTQSPVKADTVIRTKDELLKEYRELADFHEKHNLPITPTALREILDDFEMAIR